MILMIVAIMAAVAVGIVVCAVSISSKRAEKSDDARTVELLRKGRLMFPFAENDIIALDALYQSTFRELLNKQSEGKSGWEILKRDSILIFNAKNQAIIESVRSEKTPLAFEHR